MRVLLQVIAFWGLLLTQINAQPAGFVENRGQWQGAFDARLQKAYHYVFFKPQELALVLHEAPRHRFHDHEHHQMPFGDGVKGHTYKMQWIGANPKAVLQKEEPVGGPVNYLKGRNRAQWRSGVQAYQSLTYANLYPGIDLHYQLFHSGFKYEFYLQPFTDPTKIRWQYAGLDTVVLQNGQLILQTSVETVVENAPEVFWLSPDGERHPVEAGYRLKNGVLSFDLGRYPKEAPLVIDPQLIFSTYSGSTADNWGFTATPAQNDGAYGGGIVFDLPNMSRYPTTVGAFEDSAIGDIDIGITKFSGDGRQMLYSTYLGGQYADVPISTLEGKDESLIILGVTGSADFPVTATAYDTSFKAGAPTSLDFPNYIPSGPVGSHIFLTILDSTGGALLGSTLLGDSALDGINKNLHFNFGDEFRGDLAQDNNGNIFFVSNTQSPNLAAGSAVFQSTFGGGQDGLVGSFSADLSSLNWASYVGGSSNDALFSLTLTASNRLYLSGATESSDLNLIGSTPTYQPSPAGKVDALLLELNPVNGSLVNYTYTGTPEDDLAYFTDVNSQGELAVFGQTYGAWPIVDNRVYNDSNSSQFLQLLDANLNGVLRSTVFGTGQRNFVNISPTALLIDDCGNLLLSGFMPQAVPNSRGLVASIFTNGNLPLKNPVRSTLYNRDFYFLALDPSWQKLRFATFFGDTSAYDHVDGGSSRFRQDGSIIQGVCAGCGGSDFFPTTDSAFATQNGSTNCNLAVFRFDFDVEEVEAVALLEPESRDSACIPYTSLFFDASRNADLVIAVYPDGTRDTVRNGAITVVDTGISRLKFFAVDTNCNTLDSTFLEFYGVAANVEAQFEYAYDSCANSNDVFFTNTSGAADAYRWFFGDGDSSVQANPQHQYEPGTYQIKLIATNTFCRRSDTLTKSITISNRSNNASLQTEYDPCEPDTPAVFRAFNRGFHLFEWSINGEPVAEDSDSLVYNFTKGGRQRVQVRLIDTLCANELVLQDDVVAFGPQAPLQMPNVFTPNGDGQNDTFGPLNAEDLDFLQRYVLKIYDRNGRLLFTSTQIEDRWDGTVDGQQAHETVFYYLLEYQDACGRINELKGFTHCSL